MLPLRRYAARPISGCLALGLMTVLALTACERKKPEPVASVPVDAAPQLPALAAQPVKIKLKAEGRCGDRCAEFEADWLHFPQQPALNAALQALSEAPDAADPQAGIRSLGQRFLADAAETGEPWQQSLEATLRPGLGPVSVIDVVIYTFTGGAHGMTASRFINWDRQRNAQVRLADILLPGREKAFWAEAQRAHQVWVRQHDDAESLGAGWPFGKTDNVALKPDALVLQYQPYEIGPYSEGSPELSLDYGRLKGVLKPEYLPAR